MDLSDKVSVTQMWVAPDDYRAWNLVLNGRSLTETCPDGIFVRILTESQILLSVQNATRDEAKQMITRNNNEQKDED